MRSIIHGTFGDPAKVLHLADNPMPEPGAGEVRIRTLLSPIHNHDVWTVQGNYGYKPPLPAIGGSEAVGIVDAVGAGVPADLLGKRVAVAGVHGTWAEYFLAPAALIVPVPDAIADEAAAQLIAMPFSAITLLEFLEVDRGDWIVLNAANGAVGKQVAMLSKARGIHMVGLVRRDAGIAELKALGIDHVVATSANDWREQVRTIVNGAPIRAAVDSLGGEASGDLAELLGEDGLLVSFGAMSGQPMQIPSGAVIFKHLTVKGFWGSKVSAAISPQHKRELLGELIRLVAAGTLKLPAEAVFDFGGIAAAIERSLAAGKSGKVLLKP